MDRVIEECNRSFADYDVTGYSRIIDMLADMPRTSGIEQALRLAEAGPTLSSPRFAYPHIKSALRGE